MMLAWLVYFLPEFWTCAATSVCFWSFCLFRVTPVAYGGSQARGPIRTVAQPMPQPQQLRIWAMSVTYTTAHSNAESLIHWAGPGIQLSSSWMLVVFANRRAMTGILATSLFFFLSFVFLLLLLLLLLFLGPLPRHMEILRLGVQLEL